MLKKNYLIQKLNDGLPVLGTWIVIPSVESVDIIGSTGLDFVIIDREHGPISFETAQKMCIACESRNISPIMRVGDIEKSFIQNAMDIGVHGIQIPNISNKEDAQNVVKYSKYPPIGDRGFSPFTRAGNYSINNASKLITNANDNTLVVLNIEGSDAIKNIDAILDVKNVDILFVGLFDLSKELGIPGEVDNPLVLEKLQIITNKAKSKGKHVGTIATNQKKINQFIDMGLKYIVYLVDCEVLRSSYSSVVKEFNKKTLK